MSPGKVTCRRGIQLDNKARKRKQHDEAREAKRRRIELKEARCTRQYQNTVREGDTYQSDIGLWHSSDIHEVPTPIAAPQNENLMSINSTAKIVFDVETTSLGNTCQ